jgi:uncharacterized membrane protein YfcA
MLAPEFSITQLLVLIPLTFIVAFAYSTVGLGGGTGYLAIMSLVGVAPTLMSPTALFLNIIVTGAALLRYGLAHRIKWRIFLPFLLSALPASFAGGFVKSSDRTFQVVLAIALFVVSLSMFYSARSEEEVKEPKTSLLWTVGILAGAPIGFFSGFLGIGGGVFLGPLVLLLRWAGAKEVAAMNSLLILIVSATALVAQGISKGISLNFCLPLAITVLIGGLLGAHIGETRLSASTLKRIFAVIILIAGIKAGISGFFGG